MSKPGRFAWSSEALDIMRVIGASADMLDALAALRACFDGEGKPKHPQDVPDRCATALAVLDKALPPRLFRAWKESVGCRENGTIPPEPKMEDDGGIVTPRQDDTLNQPISSLQLSARAWHVLKHMNVDTVGELANVSEFDMKCRRNVGQTTLCEFKTVLTGVGLAMQGL